MPDYLAIVTAERALYPPGGLTAEQGVTLCNRVALRLQALGESAGLLYKPDGVQWAERATDIICFPDGSHYDCLVNREAAALPAWQFKGRVDPARYREPFPTGPSQPDPPDGPGDPEPPDEDRLDAVIAALTALQASVAVLTDATLHLQEIVAGFRSSPLTVKVRW